MAAAKKLAEEGIEATVVDMYSIKPLDKQAIMEAKDSRLIVTLEEHSKMGGLGAAVAEVMCEDTGFPSLLRLVCWYVDEHPCTRCWQGALWYSAGR